MTCLVLLLCVGGGLGTDRYDTVVKAALVTILLLQLSKF